MVAPEGETVSLRPAVNLLIVALIDAACVILAILAWTRWPQMWPLWLLAAILCVPFTLISGPLLRRLRA